MKIKYFSNLSIVIIISILIFSSGISLASGNEKKWYIGAGTGVSEIESDIVVWTILNPGHLDQTERVLAFKVFGGYQINDFFSIELFYLDFGTLDVTANSDGRITSEGVVWEFTQNGSLLETDLTTIGLGVVFALPLKKISENNYLKRITPFTKLGIHYWNVEKTLTPPNSVNYYEWQDPTFNLQNPTTHISEDDSNFSWYYGAGLSFTINQYLSIICGWEWYSIGENRVDDADFVYSSVVIKF
jgi:opacity protein-like surface antigen